MRIASLVLLIPVLLAGQSRPNCTGVARDVDARCACEKDPSSKLCEMVRAGFYEPVDFRKVKPNLAGYWGGESSVGVTRMPSVQPAKPQPARVVPLAHKDYLRFLHPNAQLALGIDFKKVFDMAAMMGALFEQEDGKTTPRALAALKETDNMWLSVANERDALLLMTGRFEQGAAANLFYSQGIRPVFLGGAGVMLIGAEPSIQAALARLAAAPSNAAGQNWISRRAREMAKDHEIWIAGAPPAILKKSLSPFSGVQEFAIGVRLSSDQGIDGEVVADSAESAERIAVWLGRIKELLKGQPQTEELASLTLEKSGANLRFSTKGLASQASKPASTPNPALDSEFGAELYSLVMAGIPGQPPRAVAGDKLRQVKKGMKSEEVIALVGPPLGVMSIQGLEESRENWTYQVAFGKQMTLRLDANVVTVEPHP